jgi:hypothetical protein
LVHSTIWIALTSKMRTSDASSAYNFYSPFSPHVPSRCTRHLPKKSRSTTSRLLMQCSSSTSAAPIWSGAAPVVSECHRNVVNRCMLACAHPGGTNTIRLRHFRKRRPLADGFKRYLGLEFRQMGLSFLQFRSLLSSGGPP